MPIPKRFAVIPQWFKARARGVADNPSLGELLHFLASPPPEARGNRYIESITEENGFYKVSLKGLSREIYWPISWGRRSLGMVVSEQFDPTDWHYYQIPETKLRPDDIAVDCGAAEGLFTVFASMVCKFCYCVEPAPSFQEPLRKTFAGATNVEIVPCLVSDHEGEAIIEDQGISSKESESGTKVRVTTLDALFFDQGRPLTYLKADVEGAEIRLLQGALKTIREYRPRIAITTYHDRTHAGEITRILRGLNLDYQIKTKGILWEGQPVLLHAW